MYTVVAAAAAVVVVVVVACVHHSNLSHCQDHLQHLLMEIKVKRFIVTFAMLWHRVYSSIQNSFYFLPD